MIKFISIFLAFYLSILVLQKSYDYFYLLENFKSTVNSYNNSIVLDLLYEYSNLEKNKKVDKYYYSTFRRRYNDYKIIYIKSNELNFSIFNDFNIFNWSFDKFIDKKVSLSRKKDIIFYINFYNSTNRSLLPSPYCLHNIYI